MKIFELARPNWSAVAVAALAGTAVGFAAGFVVGRDPAAARRVAGRVTQTAATGVEQATLWAAQLRERIGDLWAEAREGSLGTVDAADFERHAAAATAAAAAASSGPTPAQPAPRGGTPAASKRRSKPDAESKARAKARADAKTGAKGPVRSDTAARGGKGVRASRRKVEVTTV